MPAVVTLRQLLESGVHFGHRTERWNPKTKRYIFTERNGMYIIDLQQSLDYIDRAYEFIKETVAHGGTILYVGTKKQAQEAIAEQARRVGMPFVNQRWLGGMLTNFSTVFKRLQRLKELEEIDFGDVAGSGMTKKELLQLKRERDKLERTLGGIRDMARVPSAIWVVDTWKEHIAVSEARKLGIPVVGILDTNCDPDEVSYPIPGNDDAIPSITLLTRVISDAVAAGLADRAGEVVSLEKSKDLSAPFGDRFARERSSMHNQRVPTVFQAGRDLRIGFHGNPSLIDIALARDVDLLARLESDLSVDSRSAEPELYPDYLNTLAHANNVAAALQAAGESARAVNLFAKIYNRRQELLGSEHPSTLTSLNNLAAGYQELGKSQIRSSCTSRYLKSADGYLAPTTPTRWCH